MRVFFRSALCLFIATATSMIGCALFPQETQEAQEAQEAREAQVPLRLLLADGSTVEKEMDEYLLGVLAGEMPASFPEEALKAQAVASRSYAVHALSTGKHGENTLCAQSCCQIYLTEAQCRDKWGADYALYADKLRACNIVHGTYDTEYAHFGNYT